MNTSIDPADAARDLQIAAARRQALADEARRPFWIYPALSVYTLALYTLEDFVPQAGFWVIVAMTVVLVLTRSAPAFRLRVRSRLGLRAGPASNVVPAHTRIAIRVVLLIVALGSLLLLNYDHLLADIGAPAWAVRHTITVFGVAMAIIIMPVTWVLDRITRHYMMRGGR
jgi:hypothetical protein